MTTGGIAAAGSASQQVQPLAVREQPVRDHDVRRLRAPQSRTPGVDRLGDGDTERLAPTLEGPQRQLDVPRVILDEQDVEGGRSSPAAPSRVPISEALRLVSGIVGAAAHPPQPVQLLSSE